MKSGSYRTITNKRRGAHDNKTCSVILLLLSTIILFWLGFLLYSLKSGRWHSNSEPSLNYVNGFLNVANKTFRDGLSNLPHKAIPENIDASGITDIHVIFSTDCSPYQDWQSLVMFYSATAVGQKGPVTRIASGCDDEKKETLTALYKKLYPKYHVHFTPDFKKDEKTKRNYDFYNKPWGVKHWLEFAVPEISDGIAVALLDPDMIFLRPLTTRVRGQSNNLHDKKLKEEDIVEFISIGNPVAQLYGLGAPWANDNHKKFNRTRVCGEGSPCLSSTVTFGEQHYSVGPPYIMIKEDMVKLTKTWTTFVPRVFEKYPYLLAEMYAYSMAAAHENLPHLQLENFMVSNTNAGGEGWPLVDKLDDACAPPVDGIYFPGVPLPNLVHYCQNFRAGDLGFAKRQLRRDIFTCEAPLLVEPPANFISVAYRIKDGERQNLQSKQVKRNVFTLCVVHRTINAALKDYKERMCEPKSANYEKTLIVLAKG